MKLAGGKSAPVDDHLRRAATGVAPRVLVVGATAAEAGVGLAGVTEIARVTPVARDLLEALATSDMVVLALPAPEFSVEARHICLLAFHASGRFPVITADDPARAASVQSSVAAYAAALGAIETPSVVARNALAGAVGDALQAIARTRASAPLRMLLKAGRTDGQTTVSGSLVCGAVEPGLEVAVLPAARTAVIAAVNRSGSPGEATLQLDRPLPVEQGSILAAAAARPELADQVAAHVIWIDEQPMLPGRSYTLHLGHQTTTCQIGLLKHKLNPADLNPTAARRLTHAEIGLCNVSFGAPLVFDQAEPGALPSAGLVRFTLEDTSSGRLLGFGRVAFTLRRATNIHWQALAVDKAARASLKGQRPCCLWFTGLSGSGKSTLASLLEKRLNSLGRHTYTLDGDNVRHGLNRDLGFTDADRVENIRRVAEVSKLFVEAGLIVMVSFISPFRAERELARTLYPAGEFLEVHVDTPIEVCERRDPKGLYKKARAGQLKNFTGIDSPYEPPERPELRLDSASADPEALVEQILRELMRRGIV